MRTLLSYLEGNAVAGTNRAWPDASVRCPHRRGTGTRLRRYGYSPGTSDVSDNDGFGRLVAPDPNAAHSPNDTTSCGRRNDCRSRRSQVHALGEPRNALTSTNATGRRKELGRPPWSCWVVPSPASPIWRGQSKLAKSMPRWLHPFWVFGFASFAKTPVRRAFCGVPAGLEGGSAGFFAAAGRWGFARPVGGRAEAGGQRPPDFNGLVCQLGRGSQRRVGTGGWRAGTSSAVI